MFIWVYGVPCTIVMIVVSRNVSQTLKYLYNEDYGNMDTELHTFLKDSQHSIRSNAEAIVTQHIEMDQLGQKSKINFVLFRDDYSVRSILVQIYFKLDITFSRDGNFVDDVITDCRRVDLEKKKGS